MSDQQSTTYKIYVLCGNCSFRKEIEIPKGTLISETPCPECGNLTLDKDHNAHIFHRPSRPPTSYR